MTRRRRVRRAVWGAAVVVVALLAAAGSMATVGATRATIGAVTVRLAVVPSTSGGTLVLLPPLGEMSLRTQAGPLGLRVQVSGIDVARAGALLDRGATADAVADGIEADVRTALLHLLMRTLVVALVAASLASVLVFRRRAALLLGAGSTLIALVAAGGVAAATLNTRALSEPRFTGLLSRAPALTGGLSDVQGRFDVYRTRIAALTGSVSRLYDTLETLPATSPATPAADDIPLLWVSDIHNNPEAFTLMQTLIKEFGCVAVLDTGDDTDLGSAAENPILAPIATLGVPYVVVRGNHDSLDTTQAYLATLPNVTVLDSGSSTVVKGVRIAGEGDPRYAPSALVRSSGDPTDLRTAGRLLAAALDGAAREGSPVDIAMVHEPQMAVPLFGHVPLVLDGHIHHRASASADDTLELTQGSSGGAGLRTLETSTPQPLEMSVLHIDAVTHRLTSVDDLTVAGVGQDSATLQRHAAASYLTAKDSEPKGSEPTGSEPTSAAP